MQTVKIQIEPSQAKNIAIHQLDRAIDNQRAVVSDPCVLHELKLEAERRGIKIEFYGYSKNERIVLTDGEIDAVLGGYFEILAREIEQGKLL